MYRSRRLMPRLGRRPRGASQPRAGGASRAPPAPAATRAPTTCRAVAIPCRVPARSARLSTDSCTPHTPAPPRTAWQSVPGAAWCARAAPPTRPVARWRAAWRRAIAARRFRSAPAAPAAVAWCGRSPCGAWRHSLLLHQQAVLLEGDDLELRIARLAVVTVAILQHQITIAAIGVHHVIAMLGGEHLAYTVALGLHEHIGHGASVVAEPYDIEHQLAVVHLPTAPRRHAANIGGRPQTVLELITLLFRPRTCV